MKIVSRLIALLFAVVRELCQDDRLCFFYTLDYGCFELSWNIPNDIEGKPNKIAKNPLLRENLTDTFPSFAL